MQHFHAFMTKNTEMSKQSSEHNTGLFYIRTQSVQRSKHSPTLPYKTTLLMLYKTRVSVCSKIHTQLTSAMWASCRIL